MEDGLHQDGDDRDSQGLQGVGGKMVFTRVVMLGIVKDYRAVGLWGMSLACQWGCFGLQEVDISVSLARPQLANKTEISAEAKATTVFLLPTTSTCTTLIQDSVPKLKMDFLNNQCSDLNKI